MRLNETLKNSGSNVRQLASMLNTSIMIAFVVCVLMFAHPCTGQQSVITLHLKEEATSPGTVIYLSDVVAGYRGDSAIAGQIADIPLMPAPQRPHRLRRLEIAEHLSIRGIDMELIAFAGSESVLIHGRSTNSHGQTTESSTTMAVPNANGVPSRSEIERVNHVQTTDGNRNHSIANDRSYQSNRPFSNSPATEMATHAARSKVSEISVNELRRVVGQSTDWLVTSYFDEQYIPFINQHVTIQNSTIRGIRQPWTDVHNATLQVSYNGQRVSIPLTLEVQANTMVVSAKSDLTRGDLVTESDVELTPIVDQRSLRRSFANIESVVGQQLTQDVRSGEILTESELQPEILIERNETVTVIAQVGETRVQTTATATQQGSLGDVIQVKTTANESVLTVQVTGRQMAQIINRPTQSTASRQDLR